MNKTLIIYLLFALIPCTVSAQKNVKLFDGISFTGWKVSDPTHKYLWGIKEGMIIGGDSLKNVPVNSYLCTDQEFENFEFRCLFKMGGDTTGFVNSGIQYRSKLANNDIIGYQADIGNGYWGDIYDEHRRGKIVSGSLSVANKLLNPWGWNSYIIRCIGNRHETYINGVKVADYLEKDTSVPNKGIIGIQIHSGGKALIYVKDVEIEILP